MKALDRLTIRGYKSIQALEGLELRELNVVIGSNGAGKSNFVSFFTLMRNLMQGKLHPYVVQQGGADDMMFGGPKRTDKLSFELMFGERGYRFILEPTVQGTFLLSDEARYDAASKQPWCALGYSPDGVPRLVKEIREHSADAPYSAPVYEAIMSWRVYHFHDTSATAPMRRYAIVQDTNTLRSDASNIAPFLLHLKETQSDVYKEIVRAVRMVIPSFGDFLLKPQRMGESEQVCLTWVKDGSDYPMQPYHLSDGSIRFICLATALLQPNPPSTMIIDEPELGLHPEAIAMLAELMKAASTRTQVIAATQSPLLVDCFRAEDIVVAQMRNGATTFRRLKTADLEKWLEDYSLGDLWVRNIIHGGSSYV